VLELYYIVVQHMPIKIINKKGCVIPNLKCLAVAFF